VPGLFLQREPIDRNRKITPGVGLIAGLELLTEAEPAPGACSRQAVKNFHCLIREDNVDALAHVLVGIDN
jgi:hypothetical protein